MHASGDTEQTDLRDTTGPEPGTHPVRPGMLLTRRKMLTLTGATALSVPFILSGCTSSSGATTLAGGATTLAGGGSAGASKSVVTALAYASCPCVGIIMVGARNAAELVGWDYQGVITDQEDNPDTLNATYEQSITLQPDVMVGGMWFDPAEVQAERAISEGIRFIAVNTARTEWLQENDVAYVGQDLYLGGVLVGRETAEILSAKGVSEGLILTGNVSPGSLPIEERFRGIADGVSAYNDANGTTFTTEQFPDESADLATSLPIYQAKILEVGDQLVALAGTSTQTHIANYRLAQEEGWEPGEIVISGFDTDPLINEAIEAGFSSFTIDQQFFAQGFMAVMQAWQWVTRGMVPPAIYDTGNAVVTADNIAAINERDLQLNELAGDYGIQLGT